MDISELTDNSDNFAFAKMSPYLNLQNFGHDNSRSHHFVGSEVSQTSSAPEGAHSGHCTGDHGVDAANFGHCDASPLRADVAGRHASVRRPHHPFECALVVV